jgi:hypothetical protein
MPAHSVSCGVSWCRLFSEIHSDAFEAHFASMQAYIVVFLPMSSVLQAQTSEMLPLEDYVFAHCQQGWALSYACHLHCILVSHSCQLCTPSL